jgi:cation diffusion facilitator CzcD-associated flavoprotein CzcO
VLQSGRLLPADAIVTATGYAAAAPLPPPRILHQRAALYSCRHVRLQLNHLGDVIFSIDGQSINFAETIMYKGTMFSGVPNLAVSFGYVNASWWAMLCWSRFFAAIV